MYSSKMEFLRQLQNTISVTGNVTSKIQWLKEQITEPTHNQQGKMAIMLKQRSLSASWEGIKEPERLKHGTVPISAQLKHTHLYLACKICNLIPQTITEFNESVILLYSIQCQSHWTSFNDPVYLFLPIIQEENSQPAGSVVSLLPSGRKFGYKLILLLTMFSYLGVYVLFPVVFIKSCIKEARSKTNGRKITEAWENNSHKTYGPYFLKKSSHKQMFSLFLSEHFKTS